MNIYEVKFTTTVYIDEESKPIVEDVDEEQLREGLKEGNIHAQMFTDKFHVGAYSLGKAFLAASEFLDGNIGENQYEIVGIKEKENIQVVNWPNDTDECQCLNCRTDRAAEEDKLKFSCKGCGFEIVVVDGWDAIQCPSCGIEILRDRILGSQGNYVMMDIDKLPKKKIYKTKKTNSNKTGNENGKE